ncbi:RSP_7527 family protein [Motiliproteus sp. SC1-56]|uniref:RSP_7527 family protein n=1 Tax=Motiliproteus sp. SC1-56 TaxID=2799565 RepID=UPI001A8CBA16|nr:hypothetical protein [Motiliproteus sp. SC1-56]
MANEIKPLSNDPIDILAYRRMASQARAEAIAEGFKALRGWIKARLSSTRPVSGAYRYGH